MIRVSRAVSRRVDLFALIALEQHLANAADDPSVHAFGTLFDRGVQAILRRQPVADIG